MINPFVIYLELVMKPIAGINAIFNKNIAIIINGPLFVK